MTDFILYTLVAFFASVLTSILWIRHGNSWSDNDYYSLVEKYAEAASALTAMKAELDKLQEQLEFSEDVRYTLGMENAKLAKEIEGLKRDVEKGEEVRDMLARSLADHQNLNVYLAGRIVQREKSLRIARHKEFKRWKKGILVGWRQLDRVSVKPETHGRLFNRAVTIRQCQTIKHYKLSIPEFIRRSKQMKAYPLP